METKREFIKRMIELGECKNTKEDIVKYSNIYDTLSYWSTPNGNEEWKIICNRLERVLRRKIEWATK